MSEAYDANPEHPKFAQAAKSVLSATGDAATAGERIDRLMGRAGALSAREEHVVRKLFPGDSDPIGRYRRRRAATTVGAR